LPQGAEVAPVDATTFVTTVMSSDQYEIRSSRFVLDQGASGDVAAFARQMVQDHTESTRRLLQAAAEVTSSTAARSGSESAMPMLPKHRAMLGALDGLRGADLEARYLADQQLAHQEAVALFGAYATGGEDEALRSFAETVLPTLRQHLQLVEDLARGG
jgi:putative membrane protein